MDSTIGLIDGVLKERDEQAIEHCGLLLLTIPQAIDVVLAAKMKGVGLLGIEAFDYENNNVCPLMDWIADYSRAVEEVGFMDSSCNAALCFLAKLAVYDSANSKDVFVELVFL